MVKQSSIRETIFFAAPISVNKVVEFAVETAAHNEGYDVVQPHDILPSAGSTVDLVRNLITEASLVIADVSDKDPTVMWELGYALALNKAVLFVTTEVANVPFDLRSARVITFQHSSTVENMIARLQDAIESTRIDEGSPRKAKSAKRPKRHKVFFSYSHADAEYLDRMLVHLRPVERAGVIDLWSDTKLRAGDRWRDEIKRALEEARAAVLLISADFLASEFIVSDELPPLLAAAERDGARIIPVIVKPSRFLRDENLSRFQSLNDPKLPIIRRSEAAKEELYAELAEIIETEIAL